MMNKLKKCKCKLSRPIDIHLDRLRGELKDYVKTENRKLFHAQSRPSSCWQLTCGCMGYGCTLLRNQAVLRNCLAKKSRLAWVEKSTNWQPQKVYSLTADNFC